MRVQSVLDQALAQKPAVRDAALRAACRGDERLLSEALALLPFYTEAGDCEPPRSPVAGLQFPATTTLLTLRREAQQSAAAETLPSPPFLIDQYLALNCLGAGGMGVVYRAAQAMTGCEVAIKIMRRRLRNTEERQQFAFEGEVLRQFQHPGIARFRHSGIATLHPRVNGQRVVDERPYFVMEYVHGMPVTWYANRARLDVLERLELLERVCEAIEYAHYRGIVHCDLKPDNILVDAAGQPKVVDFGIARFTTWHHTDGSVRERVAGTRAYASPEQVLGQIKEIGPPSDVYALGLITHELLTGRRPRRSGFDIEIDLRGLRAPRELPTNDARLLAYYLRDVLATSLRQTSGRSYRTAGEFGAALAAVRNGAAAACRRGFLDTLRREPLKMVMKAFTSPLERPLQAIVRARIQRSADIAASQNRRPAK